MHFLALIIFPDYRAGKQAVATPLDPTPQAPFAVGDSAIAIAQEPPLICWQKTLGSIRSNFSLKKRMADLGATRSAVKIL